MNNENNDSQKEEENMKSNKRLFIEQHCTVNVFKGASQWDKLEKLLLEAIEKDNHEPTPSMPDKGEWDQMEEYKHGYREGWNDCMIYYKIKNNQ